MLSVYQGCLPPIVACPQATRNGAIIMPPVPAFYALPVTLDDVVNQTVGRALELLDIALPGIKRWNGVNVDDNVARGD
jgi:4-hydroxy-3-polyprenylbenzoate decarboxylase